MWSRRTSVEIAAYALPGCGEPPPGYSDSGRKWNAVPLKICRRIASGECCPFGLDPRNKLSPIQSVRFSRMPDNSIAVWKYGPDASCVGEDRKIEHVLWTNSICVEDPSGQSLDGDGNRAKGGAFWVDNSPGLSSAPKLAKDFLAAHPLAAAHNNLADDAVQFGTAQIARVTKAKIINIPGKTTQTGSVTAHTATIHAATAHTATAHSAAFYDTIKARSEHDVDPDTSDDIHDIDTTDSTFTCRKVIPTMFAWQKSGTEVGILEDMSEEDFEKFDNEEEPEETKDMDWQDRRVEKFKRHGAVFYTHWDQHPLSLRAMTGSANHTVSDELDPAITGIAASSVS